MSDKAEFEPIMPFWIDTDGYSERDREMFTCGVEFQMVYEAIKSGAGWSQCIHTENASRVRMMCGKLEIQARLTHICSTWTDCQIPPMDDPPEIDLEF